MKVILASTSPTRRKILASAGVVVEAISPGVDEDPRGIEDPVALAGALALRKALAIGPRPDTWVLGSDQVAYDPEHRQDNWGKPKSAVDHLERLKACRGRVHDLATGWALVGPDGAVLMGVERAHMHVRADLTDEELQAYVGSGEGANCAGGYAVEGLGAFLFQRIEGDWYTVLGLPLFPIMGALREVGWRFGSRP